MKTPDFLNVDLDIESKSPLDSVAQEFGDRVVVTFSGRMKGCHCLYLESAKTGRSQDAVLNALCLLVERLSESSRRVWDRANKKEFDLAYETRLSSERANRFNIRSETLRRITDLGATVAVTIYPEDSRTRPMQQTPR
jgi:hypothetical protein